MRNERKERTSYLTLLEKLGFGMNTHFEKSKRERE